MTIAKNIEISSSSTVSFEDAIKQGIAQSTKPLKTLKVRGLKNKKYASKMVTLPRIT